MPKNNSPLAWQLYQEGIAYNQELTPSQYDLVETNTEFFAGNQWLHLPDTPAMRGLPKPTFNILKRVASLFIASLTSSGIALRYEPLSYYNGSNQEDPDHDPVEFTNAAVSNLLEKLRFDYRVREALFDGAKTGDYCAHFYFDPYAKPIGGAFGLYRGEIQMELVDGINVMFGNPNDCRVQTQPYILLIGRAPVEQLKAEAEAAQKNRKSRGNAPKMSESQVDNIVQPDAEYLYMPGVGGKTEMPEDEVTGKALYVLMYTKVTQDVVKKDEFGQPIMEDEMDADGNPVYERDENGDPLMLNGQLVVKQKEVKERVTTVHVTKSTQTAIIYEDVDTGLSLYPIAWGNWERQKNQYHGRALVTGLIHNQIFINSMFATAMRHMQLMAFPKTIYNADLVSNWTNEVGQAIGIRGMRPGEGVGQVAANLQPAEMSSQIFTLIDKAMTYTKECLGATDAQMGNVRPDNTSALMVLQTNAEVPLENVRAGVYEWAEDIGNILPDMMGTYYGTRPVVVEKQFEVPVVDGGGVPVIDMATGRIRTQMETRKVTMEFDFSQLKNICQNLRIEAGATTYFSEVAMTQTLDNLRKDGTLDVIQYLERIPDKLIPRKRELLQEIKGRMGRGEQANAAAGDAIPDPGTPISTKRGGHIQGEPLPPDVAMMGLPNMQMQMDEIPNIGKKTLAQQGASRMT